MASAALTGLGAPSARGRRRRLHEGGQGLYRPGDRRRSRNGTARPPARRRRARSSSSTSRPTSATAARRASATARQEAAKALGWDFRILDGQGSVPARTSALTQAIALKPDGIILGSRRRRRAGADDRAGGQGRDQGRRLARGSGPGQDRGRSRRLHQHHHRPERGRQGLRPLRRGRFRRQGRRRSSSPTASTRSPPPRPMPRRRRSRAARAARCWRSRTRRSATSPTAWRSSRPRCSSKYGKAWTYSIAVNDLYFDFSAPSLQSAGVDPATGYPRQISAGDGSVPAFERIRGKQYPARDRRRAAASAGLADDRRTEPRLRRPAAERLRVARPPVHQRQHRQGRRRAEHLRPRQRLQGTLQEDLGREVSRRRLGHVPTRGRRA